MARAFKCPACGASLESKGENEIVHCPYCGSAVNSPPEPAAPRQEPSEEQQEATAPLTLDLRNLIGKAGQIRTVQRMALQGQKEEAARLLHQVLVLTDEQARQIVEHLSSGKSLSFAETEKMFAAIPNLRVVSTPPTPGSAGLTAEQQARRVRLVLVVAMVMLALAAAAVAFLLMVGK